MLVNEIVKRLRKGKDDISGRKNKAKETTGFHKEITGSHKGTTGSHEEARPEDPIRDAVLGLTVNQKGDPRTILMELEKGFDQVYYDLMHQKTWLPWYFAGCFSLCQHRLGLRKSKQPLDRRANGVQVLHRIVNNCIDTHGIRGLMVLCSAAGNVFEPTLNSRSELKKDRGRIQVLQSWTPLRSQHWQGLSKCGRGTGTESTEIECLSTSPKNTLPDSLDQPLPTPN